MLTKETEKNEGLDYAEIKNKQKNFTKIKDKKIIVTSALPYANGEIHLGHIASTYLPADIFTRFIKLTGNQIYHICATDDYGTPILIKSEKEDKTPQEYVNFWNERDKKDFESVGITFDFFYRTSSIENIKFVQYVFLKLYQNKHIIEKPVVQFFCTYDNKYLPDRYVIGKCPFCKADNQYSDLCESCGRVPEEILDPKCAICGNKPINKGSDHYFFKLSDFSKDLKNWLLNNKNLQPDIIKYVLNWIESGLQDWDITRDLSWGVPIPNIINSKTHERKVFYGWFDNHLCYISSLSTFASIILKKDGKKLWNESEIYHYIGKDIVYHHYLFLPAIRIGINNEYKLPDKIITRGHLLFQNRKLSKSKNWYIGLGDFVKNFYPDYLRFYFSSIVPFSQSDINFDWDNFYERINNELISNIGNFINRTLSFTKKQFNCTVPSVTEFDEADKQALLKIENIAYEVGDLIYNNNIDKAIKRILQFSTFFNQYFQNKQPWKSTSASNNTIWVSINATRALAIILFPFIPISAEKIWYQLGYDAELSNQNWYSASEILVKEGHLLSQNIEPVFKKIEKEEIERQKISLVDSTNNISP
ncbi:MAG: methionine--tRNA ligase [Nitrosopumilus sp.]|nr:methionine--tRNA ligase [Nitrosopumilus sp.]